MTALLEAFVTLQNQVTHDFSTQNADHHAVAPDGPAEVIVVVIGVLITAVVFYYTLKYMIRPGETGKDHIKRRIVNGGEEPK